MLSYKEEQTSERLHVACLLATILGSRNLGVFTPRLILQKWSANGMTRAVAWLMGHSFFQRGEAYTQLSFTLHSGRGFNLLL